MGESVSACCWVLRSCYHPDAVDDHGPFSGGVEELIEWLRPQLQRLESTAHFLGNQLVDFDETGGVAWVETYLITLRRTQAADDSAPIDVFGNGRYVDRFERRDGEWRIAHRTAVFRAGRVDPVSLGDGLVATSDAGTRDRNDPSYRRDLAVGQE